MSHEKPEFNEYRKTNEQLFWTDIPMYAKEILLHKGTEHLLEQKTMYDYRWTDELTGDDMFMSSNGLDDDAVYFIQITKGEAIDHRRKYCFKYNERGIYVYNDRSERLRDEEVTQAWLETYLHDRLMTTMVEEGNLSREGVDEFWKIASEIAVSDEDIDAAIRQSFYADKGLGNEYRNYIVEKITQSSEYGKIPHKYISSAIMQRLVTIGSTNQLEA